MDVKVELSRIIINETSDQQIIVLKEHHGERNFPIVIGIAEIVFMTVSFDWLVGFSRPLRILLGVAIIGPLAFFMGMPFPTGLRQLEARSRPLVPWAWGVNGFASVIGAVLGTLLAISVGFTALIIVALLCYLLAGCISKRLCN